MLKCVGYLWVMIAWSAIFYWIWISHKQRMAEKRRQWQRVHYWPGR